ncbi:MAG: head-tail adaptor protein [Hyphomicrobiales bacterium]|jgi:SPP1 family predicted phage head-tail adaptor|nr:head-tail adaptor protein [Hyphomicrobiales bacterium]
MRGARIGELDRKLALERPLDTPDEIGGAARAWTLVADVWGHVQPTRGVRRFAGEREESAVTHRIAIRWRPDVTGAMRLRDGAAVYSIHAATDGDGRRRFLICHCEELA